MFIGWHFIIESFRNEIPEKTHRIHPLSMPAVIILFLFWVFSSTGSSIGTFIALPVLIKFFR